MNAIGRFHGFISKKKLRTRHYLILLYIPALLASGVIFDAISAIFMSLFYEGGLIGLILLYLGPQQEKNEMQWGYLALGITLLICCYLWLEFIWSRSVPY